MPQFPNLLHRIVGIGIFAVLIGALLPAASARADEDDNFTQVGTFQIQLKSNGAQVPTFNMQGPGFVSFPKEFGAPPQVILSFATIVPLGQGGARGAPQAQLTVNPTNITAKGFTPAITSVGGINEAPITVSWMAVGSRLYSGTATASYQILTVIYAPPGTNGGHASSSVTYGAGVTSGTTTSASQSFANTIGVSVENKENFLGSGGGGSLNFDYSSKTTDTQSYEVKQSTTSTIQRPGPAQDGIIHDEDAIFLLLNAKLNLSLSSTAASWTFGDNSTSHIQYVLVGELNGHIPWRAGVLAELNAAGLTVADYVNILAVDPLARADATLDPGRYISINTMYPYEAPGLPNDPVVPTTTTISSSNTNTNETKTENDYKVGLTLSGTAGFLDMTKTTITGSASWTWTNSNSVSSSTGTTQSASLTIGGPAYGYPGLTEIAVYRDTIYNTFAFVLVPPGSMEVGLRGTVLSKSGAPLVGTEVTLNENGNTHSTLTNAHGQYVFFGHFTGPAKINTKGVSKIVPQPQPGLVGDLRVE